MDIVARLNREAMHTGYTPHKPWDLMVDAATEIDRLRAEAASLKEERDTAKMNESFWRHAHKIDADGLNAKVDHLTQQLAAANGRVELLRMNLHISNEMLRGEGIYSNQVRINDAALSNLNEDSGDTNGN